MDCMVAWNAMIERGREIINTLRSESKLRAVHDNAAAASVAATDHFAFLLHDNRSAHRANNRFAAFLLFQLSFFSRFVWH
jgi:hypothetical protein